MTFGYSQITVTLDHSLIEISNDLDSDGGAKKGYGFGQEIINRVADELGWKVETKPTPKIFTVSITF